MNLKWRGIGKTRLYNMRELSPMGNHVLDCLVGNSFEADLHANDVGGHELTI